MSGFLQCELLGIVVNLKENSSVNGGVPPFLKGG